MNAALFRKKETLLFVTSLMTCHSDIDPTFQEISLISRTFDIVFLFSFFFFFSNVSSTGPTGKKNSMCFQERFGVVTSQWHLWSLQKFL